MEDDQQFCLRWNNHQSTLISVFDTLLENETLVDCTLAAEGKFLKAHKVVLSACSPYFATLLQEQYDKHPIFILKDVKYQELRAMMDYMYRGEVNISQDQLAALLKAAESLQIKGLSDNRTGGGSGGGVPKHEPHRGMPGGGGGKHVAGGYTLEQTKRARMGPSSIDSQDLSGSREGSSSPTSRRRRKVRRRSIDNAMPDVHDNSNSSQIQTNASQLSLLQQQQQQQSNACLGGVGAITAAASALASTQVPASAAAALPTAAAVSNIASATQGTTQQHLTAAAAAATNVTKKTDSVKGTSSDSHSELLVANLEEHHHQQQQQQQQHQLELKSEKLNHKSQKSASKDAANTGSSATELVIEPKSEYDDEGNDETVEDLTLDDEDMGMEDLDNNAGTSHGNEGSSQGYVQWQHDRSQDDLLMATDAQQRDPQEMKYDFQTSMIIGENFKTERFPCARCGKSYLRKRHLQRHMRDECIGIPPRFTCELCPSRFRRKYHMVRHLTSKHGIPPQVAQQTTGGSSGGGGGGARSGCDGSGCDSPLPENLSMRKEFYDMKYDQHDMKFTPMVVGGGGATNNNNNNNNSNGGVGGLGVKMCGGATAATASPPLPATMPTYGLSGAITAIPTAVVVGGGGSSVEEAENQQNIKEDAGGVVMADAAGAGGVTIKAEPVTPNKMLSNSLMDDEWKMKLSLQLISNSLLKERLMNSMPFAYNNN